MFDRVLVPIDGSDHAKRAVKVAAGIALCHHSVVYVLYVLRDLSLPKEILEMISSGEITASRMQILQDSADIILDHARKDLDAVGVVDVQTMCLMGDPASRILEYAEEKQVDLILLGHRGLEGREGLLGGVARKVVNMTTVSCLIVA